MKEGKEEVINSTRPREDAIDFVSRGGKNKLVVTAWHDAARPSGANSHYSPEVYKTQPYKTVWSPVLQILPTFNSIIL